MSAGPTIHIEVLYEPPGPWRSEAACRNTPDMFHPGKGANDVVAAAKAVCATCPSIQPCAIYALSAPSLQGVWGGLTEVERVRARKATGRMRTCEECLEPFHSPPSHGNTSPYCSDECRHVVKLRSKAACHAKAQAVA